MNCCIPLQYVDFPLPGGPITRCPNLISVFFFTQMHKENTQTHKQKEKEKVFTVLLEEPYDSLGEEEWGWIKRSLTRLKHRVLMGA
jgi:hypothetical protein